MARVVNDPELSGLREPTFSHESHGWLACFSMQREHHVDQKGRISALENKKN